MSSILVALAILTVLATGIVPGVVGAAPVPVRAPEGTAHGFLVLRDAKAKAIAQGDWWQVPRGERIELNLRFRFTDGSMSHETFVLLQRRIWTLLSYRSVQRGPSFPRDLEAHVDRETGQYRVKTTERDKDGPKVDEGRIELPDDTYAFGMLALLLRNLEPGEVMTAHAVAFTPKPRILKLTVSPDGEDTVTIQGFTRRTARYVAKAELGGTLGVVASVAGKQPPPMRYWMAGEPVPTFARVDTPFYPEGPIWQVELAAPQWTDARAPSRAR
jgi:hypothetical protein